MTARRFLTIGSALIGLVLAWPVRGQTDGIIINNADATNTLTVTGSSDLNTLIANVGPRFVVQYANALRYYGVAPIPTDLQNLLALVEDRFVIQYANANRIHKLTYPVGLTGDTTPPQISDLTVTILGPGVVKISWTTDEYAAHTIEYGEEPGAYTQIVTDTLYYRLHEVMLPGLTLSCRYYYRLSNTDRSGNTSQSPEYSITVLLCSPSTLAATAISRTAQINLAWQDNSVDESDFHIKRSLDGNTNWLPVGTVGANVTNYSDTSVSCSTSYYYPVQAHRHGDGWFSDDSNTANGITAPCNPTNLTATVVSLTQVSLSWQDNSPDETDFHVEHSSNGSTNWSEVATPVWSNINLGLSCSTGNYYRMSAHRHSDSLYSSYSGVVSVVCPPSSLTAMVVSRTQIDLAWQDNSPDETNFLIERSPNGSTGWVQIGTAGANVASYGNTGLGCGTTYYYRARAYRGSGGVYSNYSDAVSASTLPCLELYLPFLVKSDP